MDKEFEDHTQAAAEEETKRRFQKVPSENLRKLAADIGYTELARETGYTDSALRKMIEANAVRPVLEEWARLTLKEYARLDRQTEGMELVICRVAKSEADTLARYVRTMLQGKAMRFSDE